MTTPRVRIRVWKAGPPPGWCVDVWLGEMRLSPVALAFPSRREAHEWGKTWCLRVGRALVAKGMGPTQWPAPLKKK